MTVPTPRRASAMREFFSGVGFLFRGFRIWVTAPRLMLLGMIPAAIVGLAAIAVLVALIVNIEVIATSITPFAREWSEVAQAATHFAAGLALIVASILVIVNTYTTVTLMVGDSFYRLIAAHVDAVHGAPPEQQSQGFWRDLRRGIAEGLRVLLPTVGLAVLVFALGFIPVAGGVIAASAGALLGGWLLVVELSNIPFESRGLHLTARRRTLRGSRARALGLGAATYVVFLIPLGAVVAMPAAVAGATLLTRSVLGEDARLSTLATTTEKAKEPPHER
ncbi:EI24 domain-containing protein [Salinibacterium sp. SWN1162]|uniref:EI24 domain-containing protein n=1 Tax=Salinibacterium sp. SWN1162 TaxID=2792053 RepID=UPI0018CD5732|nr:EI24 domain-containing protein [Salinibacterium sp. SWN1162]MBH0009253.1 EI24 domain-containing protein [Salinibacterium sp. SWN1162]